MITEDDIRYEHNRQVELCNKACEGPLGIESYFRNLGIDPEDLSKASLEMAMSDVTGAIVDLIKETPNINDVPKIILDPKWATVLVAAAFTRGLTVGLALAPERVAA